MKKKQLSGDRWPNWRWISGTIGLAGGESHRWHNWEVDQIAVEVDQCNPGPAGGGPVQLGGVLHGSSMLLGND